MGLGTILKRIAAPVLNLLGVKAANPIVAAGAQIAGDYFSGEQLRADNIASAQAASQISQEQLHNLWRTGPASQMEGLREAGLNPMLAVDRLAFPTSASYASPLEGSMAGAAAMQQADSSTVASAAQAKQAETQRKQMESLILLQEKQAYKAFAETIKTEYESKKLRAWIYGVANYMRKNILPSDGMGEMFSTDPAEYGLSKYFEGVETPHEVRSMAADMARNLNEQKLHEMLNVPATNEVMKVLQLILRAAVVLKSEKSSGVTTRSK